MEPTQSSGFYIVQDLGISTCRPLRLGPQSQVGTVLFPLPITSGTDTRCLLDTLGRVFPGLDLPSSGHSTEDSEQDSEGLGHHNTHCTKVACRPWYSTILNLLVEVQLILPYKENLPTQFRLPHCIQVPLHYCGGPV